MDSTGHVVALDKSAHARHPHFVNNYPSVANGIHGLCAVPDVEHTDLA